MTHTFTPEDVEIIRNSIKDKSFWNGIRQCYELLGPEIISNPARIAAEEFGDQAVYALITGAASVGGPNPSNEDIVYGMASAAALHAILCDHYPLGGKDITLDFAEYAPYGWRDLRPSLLPALSNN